MNQANGVQSATVLERPRSQQESACQHRQELEGTSSSPLFFSSRHGSPFDRTALSRSGSPAPRPSFESEPTTPAAQQSVRFFAHCVRPRRRVPRDRYRERAPGIGRGVVG